MAPGAAFCCCEGGGEELWEGEWGYAAEVKACEIMMCTRYRVEMSKLDGECAQEEGRL